MNTIHKHTLSALGAGLALMLLAGCDTTTQYGISMPDSAPAPGTISAITSDNSTPGQITLRWKNNMEAGQETLYTKVTYFDPYTNKEVVKTVSAEEFTAKGTYVAGGEYTFTLTPVNATLQEGASETVSARSTPIAPVVTSSSTPIELTIDNVFTNAQETSEGPIANAIDGNKGSFFHSAWSFGVAGRHNFEIRLDEFPGTVRLYLIARSGKVSDLPKDVEFWYSDGTKWTSQGVFHFPQPADDQTETYMSLGEEVQETDTYKRTDLVLPEGTKAIKFENIVTNGGSQTWFNLSEIGLEKIEYVVFDAEAEAKKVIDAHKAGL